MRRSIARLATLIASAGALTLLPMCSKHHDAPACTYTYSDWGACQSGGTQERTVVTATPEGCAGTPALEQTCNFVPDYGVTINAIPGLADDFIKGADVSMLAQIEVSGGKFYDEDGTEKDALAILKEHGVNWVRLRLWNHPVIATAFDTDGITVEPGQSAAGINDLARDIALAKRAKALGLKVLLDFHYSDWWADPAKQFVPQAWASMDLDQLKTAVYDFTKDAVTQLRAQDAGPDMVQIGNEVTNGMMWPLGKLDNKAPATFTSFLALLGQGTQAVRDVDPAIRIMVHIDAGGDNALYRRYFSVLEDQGADYDIIGLSYYPAWHGTLTALRDNMDDISQYFQKPVVVAETAFPWTTENADAQGNNYDGVSAETAGPSLPTVQGQATFLRDLMAAVASVPLARGLGIFYWEPDWIAVQGAGWYTLGGDGWDNQTMFDHAGKALASLNVFRAVSEDRPWVEATPVSVPQQAGLTLKTGEVPTLPPANVVFSDDSVRAIAVKWEAVDASLWTTPGSHEILGTVPKTDLTVTLPVTISLLENSGFESGLTGWSYGPITTPATVEVKAKDNHGGTYAFTWWNAASVELFVEQTVVLEPGKTYRYSVWAQGLNGHAPMKAYAQCDALAEVTADITLTGWNNWVQASIPGLAGTCTVGVRSTTNPADWGSLDDFALTEEP